jgi:hypothetical protein
LLRQIRNEPRIKFREHKKYIYSLNRKLMPDFFLLIKIEKINYKS